MIFYQLFSRFICHQQKFIGITEANIAITMQNCGHPHKFKQNVLLKSQDFPYDYNIAVFDEKSC